VARVLEAAELARRLAAPDAAGELFDDPVLVVDVESVAALRPPCAAELRRLVAQTPAVTVGAGSPPAVPTGAVRALTTVATPDEAAAIAERARARPRACVTLDRLLRITELVPVPAGLAAEAHAYSTLLAGPEHRAWLAQRRPSADPEPGRPRVRVACDGRRLSVVLDHPAVHNAFDAAMRDELAEALELAAALPELEEVVVSGEGPSFCSGGALWEFGTAPDPATAAGVRLARSVALALHRLGPRVTMRLHGACIGAGIELASFAGRVEARTDTFAVLPETGMGLVPGAGGTVGIVRRAGRQRAAWLALTGARAGVDALAAWRIVDTVVGASPGPS
jgi:hypothetical protein